MYALSIINNSLVSCEGQVIAIVPGNSDAAHSSAYLHLFATAPELLKCLEAKVSSALETITKQLLPSPTLTGYRGYSGGRAFPNPPDWVEGFMNIIAFAYGEKSIIDKEELKLSISEMEANAIENEDSEIVIRLSSKLSAVEADKYIHLFCAAPVMLESVEAIAKNAMTEIDREYKSGVEFDALGADASRFIIPDELRNVCNLVARARGVARMS